MGGIEMNKRRGLSAIEEKALVFAYKVDTTSEQMFNSGRVRLSDPSYQQYMKGWTPFSEWSKFAKDRLTERELKEVILDLCYKGFMNISFKHKTFKITSRGKFQAILAEVSRDMESRNQSHKKKSP